MKNKQLSKLVKFDTPTICNGLELIDSKFKLRGYSKEKFFCLNPNIKPVSYTHLTLPTSYAV